MFSIKEKNFLIREFSEQDFKDLYVIANNINQQAHQNKEFQPFYAFNVSVEDKSYKEKLSQKTIDFINKAINEKNAQPRSTYRLALCLPNNELIGNITLDMIPTQDKEGKLIYGDLGYFIDPKHGRNGLMSQALEKVLNKYFRYHNTMDLTIHPENIHSLRLMQRFHAQIIGIKIKTDYQGEPRLLLSLSKKDFLSRPRLICPHKKTISILSAQREREKNV